MIQLAKIENDTELELAKLEMLVWLTVSVFIESCEGKVLFN